MNTRHLETFVWVARLRSFLKAAAQLGTTQPAVSARIRELERQLGVELLSRTSRSVRLSPRGRELLRFAEQITNLSIELRRHAGDLGSIHGLVRLGATHAIAAGLLPALVSRMEQAYPGVEIQIVADLSLNLFGALMDGRLDVAFLIGPAEGPNLESRPLREVPMSWVAGPGLDVPTRAPLTARDLAGSPVLLDSEGSQIHELALEWFRASGAVPSRIHTCSGTPNRLLLIEKGLGIGIVPGVIAPAVLRQKRLRVLRCEPGLPSLQYVVSFPRRASQPMIEVIVREALRLSEADPGAWTL